MLMSTSVVDTQITDTAPVAPGNSSPKKAGYGCYETADGLLMIGAFTAAQCADLWRVLDQPEIAEVVEHLDGRVWR